MVLDVLLVVVVLVCWLVCLFACFVIACHCKITAYVGDNKLNLILSYLTFKYCIIFICRPITATRKWHDPVLAI